MYNVRNRCPHCDGDLGDLMEVMDELVRNKIVGELYFETKCCKKGLKAFTQTGMHYVERPPMFIGGN